MTHLMNDPVVQKKVIVSLPNGLHLRPQSLIVQTALGFDSNLTLSSGDQKVDAKSMLELMTLAAGFGAELLLEAKGADATAAVNTISELFESNFEEGS